MKTYQVGIQKGSGASNHDVYRDTNGNPVCFTNREEANAIILQLESEIRCGNRTPSRIYLHVVSL
jgi:hypothetical protein